MGSNCMNEVCRATTSPEWKKGWSLKSGGFATLCYNCGSAYENSVFCEAFHSGESGWRECRICGKVVHCGCIASRYLHEYMDFGGVACIRCVKRLEIHSAQSTKVPGDTCNGVFTPKNDTRDGRQTVVEKRSIDDKFSTERLMQLPKAIGVNDKTSTLDQLKGEEPMRKTAESCRLMQTSSLFVKATDNSRPKQGVKEVHEAQNFFLTTPLGSSSSSLVQFPGAIVEDNERNKGSSGNGQRARPILPKPPNWVVSSQTLVARPPAEGKGRNQLLPRYWPRISDQELQQISGDLKSTIVPLFEKILSASDSGRIGRLVLPKACAEAYFPTINQSDGIPIKIQDIKGKEWTFQFRFWPNNNSRMYVLEGVTPCIQNMQAQAGDTVIFSRRDPGGQLVIGCRKATSSVDVQDSQTPPPPNGDSLGVTDNMISTGAKASDDSHMTMLEKKKARNIKNKRLLMHNNDAMDLRITWEEAQELFRPSPSAEPTVVMVEDHEIEEFEEPPIFGKRTIFISQPSGEQEQRAQCDSCSKWRRLPVDALLSANWTCSDNVWDCNRCSCSVPEEINLKELDLFSSNKDYKKRKISDSKALKEGEAASGLDDLANAAVIGDNIGETGGESSVATTRHPRHRPGCTCIVCIQPPSGQGKHEPTCKCNVCSTVRRRFKTFMMRKKKCQSEREAGIAREKEDNRPHIEREEDISSPNKENDAKNGQLDLISDPHHEDGISSLLAGINFQGLINFANLAFHEHPPNCTPSLGAPCLLCQELAATKENVAGGGFTSGNVEHENNREGGNS